MSSTASRRPIRTRETWWAQGTARWLAQRGLTPNSISILSVVFAAGAGGCLVAQGQMTASLWSVICLLGAVTGIQLRLLCNLFDGMVAVEQGLRTKSGEIYNELPDRFADLLIFCGAGYSSSPFSWQPQLGLGVAALAVLTAYVRALGAAAGAGQHFSGPMAKQHRMAALSIGCVISALLLAFDWPQPIMSYCLGLIGIGCLITIARRTRQIVQTLEAK